MNDVVVIDIVYAYSVVIVRRKDDLVFCRVDSDVPMIAFSLIHHYRVTVHHRGICCDAARFFLNKSKCMDGVIALRELHHVTAGIFEPEVVLSLLHDGIVAATHDYRIAYNPE